MCCTVRDWPSRAPELMTMPGAFICLMARVRVRHVCGLCMSEVFVCCLGVTGVFLHRAYEYVVSGGRSVTSVPSAAYICLVARVSVCHVCGLCMGKVLVCYLGLLVYVCTEVKSML